MLLLSTVGFLIANLVLTLAPAVMNRSLVSPVDVKDHRGARSDET